MMQFVTGAQDDLCDVDYVLLHASQNQNHTLSAISHLIAAFNDLSCSAYVRAYVHAREAVHIARDASLHKIESLARLAQDIILSNSKSTVVENASLSGPLDRERVSLDVACSDDVEAFVHLYYSVLRYDGADIIASAACLRSVVARPELVTIVALICRVDTYSGREVFRNLPQAWRSSSAQQALTAVNAESSLGVGNVRPDRDANLLPDEPTILTFNVLGNISVEADGVTVPESAWKRRYARSLLALLCLKPNHSVIRQEIVRCFWGDIDYVRARDSMYTVLSALRSTLKCVGNLEYICGEMGRVWLDTTCCICDIDIFDNLARSIISGKDDDARIVESCLKLEGMYRGGTVELDPDELGFFHRRHIEIRHRFVEALLVGSRAALRLGDPRTAIWLTESAHMAHPDSKELDDILSDTRGKAHSLTCNALPAGRDDDATGGTRNPAQLSAGYTRVFPTKKRLKLRCFHMIAIKRHPLTAGQLPMAT